VFLIERCSPDDVDAAPLVDALSEHLRTITGSDGRGSFTDWTRSGRAVFVIARRDGEPVGCGAIRPFTEETAELKRMYARYPGLGIGRAILAYLEGFAKDAGYGRVYLSTRRVNVDACTFYRNNGYTEIESYGGYATRVECICFEKIVV
jgi:GNAT superfamily N-acetyltransferase